MNPTQHRHLIATGAKLAAVAWIAGGSLWLLGALVHHDTGWRFFIGEVSWIGADVFLLTGLLGLWRLHPHGNSRPGNVAFTAAVVGRVIFLAAESTLLVTADNNNTIGTALLPIAAAMTAVSMLAVGVIIVRQDVWHGASRFAPLAMGIYPFVAMFPVVAATGAPNLASIGCWGLPAIAVGLATRPATTLAVATHARVAVAS